MERNNGGLDGVQEKSKEETKRSTSSKSVGWNGIIIRVLTMLLTLVAAILLGINKQTKIIAISISPDLPAFNVPVLAKSSYVSAFVFFVVANSIASVFSAISLILALASKGGRKGFIVSTIILMDLMMVALLFSCIGAAGAVGLLGAKGNSHLHWNKVCDVYGKFCHKVEVAVALSFFAAVLYLLLVLLSVSKLQRGS